MTSWHVADLKARLRRADPSLIKSYLCTTVVKELSRGEISSDVTIT